MCTTSLSIFINGPLDCFYVLTIVESVAMDIGGRVLFQIMVFSRYMLKSGIVGLYASSILFYF